MRRFIILFFLFFPVVVSAENFDENLLKKADTFFKNQQYYKAEIFYDAYLTETKSCDIKFKSALCRYKTGRFDEAVKYFKEISDECDENLSLKSNLILSDVYLKLDEPGLALLSLSNLEKMGKYENVQNMAKYEKFWLYLRFGKLDKAVHEIENFDDSFSNEIKAREIRENINLFDKKVKSPVLGGLFSIIPGGGYLYCKRYKDAGFAFFINSLLMGATYEAFDNDMNIAGCLMAGIAAGFYSGNIYGGIRAAEVENKLYRRNLYKDFEKKFKRKDLSIEFSLININF